MTAEGPQPEEPVRPGGRSRKIYWLWGAALTFLLGLGLLCWVVVPVWRVRCKLKELVAARGEFDALCIPMDVGPKAVEDLGGKPAAARSLRLYLRLPDRISPDKDAAICLLVFCGRHGVLVLAGEVANRGSPWRCSAAQMLAGLGPGAQDATAALAQLLRDGDTTDRQAAARALEAIGPGASQAVDALIAALSDEDPLVRGGAVDALGSIGPAAADAVPALVRLLKNRDSASRSSVLAAMLRLGPKGRAVLVRLLCEGNELERGEAATTFMRDREAAKCALPTLAARLLKEKDKSVRSWCLEAIEHLGPEAAPAVPALLQALDNDGYELVRGNSARALGKIGTKAALTVPALIRALKDGDPYVRRSAAYALGCLAEFAKAAEAPVEALLTDPDREVRVDAAKALKKIKAAHPARESERQK